MSRGSQHYYSSRSRRDERNLPSIRDVVGNELEGRVMPNPYAFGDVMGALPISHRPQRSRESEHRDLTLPPIRQSNHSSSRDVYRDTGGNNPTAPPQAHHNSASGSYREPGRAGESGYIYGVLRPSATAAGDLIHATPPAARPHGILRQSTSITQEQDPDRRHRCDYCGKAFDRPSSLEVHLRTHTGSQPFACEWPGCNRTFSVRSNMLRHWRSHKSTSSSSQHHEPFAIVGDDGYNSDTHQEASRYFHSSSSSSQPSTSKYYSSSRRK